MCETLPFIYAILLAGVVVAAATHPVSPQSSGSDSVGHIEISFSREARDREAALRCAAKFRFTALSVAEPAGDGGGYRMESLENSENVEKREGLCRWSLWLDGSPRH